MPPQNKYVKVKTIEVSAQSFFGRQTEMDKQIENYVNRGWRLESKRKVRNKQRYTLTFVYEMSPAEIEKAKKAEKRRNLGCLTLILIAIVYTAVSNNQQQAARNAAFTATSQAGQTRVALRNMAATQTATLWTPTYTPSKTPTSTATFTPSITFTPSNTFTPSATYTASLTPSPTRTPLPSATATITATFPPTRTPRAASTPVPTTVAFRNTGGAQVYYASTNLRVRACPRTSCDLITTLPIGSELQVVGSSDGEVVNQSAVWHIILYNGSERYVHSTLVSINRPAPTSVPQSNGAIDSAVSTPVAPPPAAGGCSCGGDTLNCNSFNRQSDAQACFNQCIAEVGRDIHKLDQDNDGYVCESL